MGHGSGVEIIENRPYENNNEKGQYTLKVFHVDERLPGETPRFFLNDTTILYKKMLIIGSFFF